MAKHSFGAIFAFCVVTSVAMPAMAGMHDYCELHDRSGKYTDYAVLEVTPWLGKLTENLKNNASFRPLPPRLLNDLSPQENFFCSFQITKNGRICNVVVNGLDHDRLGRKRLYHAIKHLNVTAIGAPKNNLPYKRGVLLEFYNAGTLNIAASLDNQNYTDDQIAEKPPGKYIILNRIGDPDLRIVPRNSI